MNGHIGFQLKVFREGPSLGDEHVCLRVCNCFTTALPSQQSFPNRRQDGREKLREEAEYFALDSRLNCLCPVLIP